ncbi:MAG: hypothetical protein N2489_04645 [Clostridia bacterium]|nr:hypothetical protein [Clostridia bacterium]
MDDSRFAYAGAGFFGPNLIWIILILLIILPLLGFGGFGGGYASES